MNAHAWYVNISGDSFFCTDSIKTKLMARVSHYSCSPKKTCFVQSVKIIFKSLSNVAVEIEYAVTALLNFQG